MLTCWFSFSFLFFPFISCTHLKLYTWGLDNLSTQTVHALSKEKQCPSLYSFNSSEEAIITMTVIIIICRIISRSVDALIGLSDVSGSLKDRLLLPAGSGWCEGEGGWWSSWSLLDPGRAGRVRVALHCSHPSLLKLHHTLLIHLFPLPLLLLLLLLYFAVRWRL